MSTEVAIETRDLVKKFNKQFTALDKVSIKIHKGELVGYVGQNGAGKTTTIKILTNLLKPTSGEVYVEGIDVTKRPKEALRNVGTLIEVPGVYEYLTPHEMLSYFGKIYQMKNIDERIKEVLGLMNLTEWEHKKLGSFSTGMQRRFGIAKAILHNPDILLLDEPVLGLDPKGMKDVRDLVKRLHKEGMTIFISSHLLQELSETVNRVIFIKKGRILESDTIESIKGKVRPDVINITFKDALNPDDIERMRSIGSVKDISQLDGHNLSLHFDGGPDAIYQILKRAIELDMKIISYAPQTTNLEEYYLRVMGDLEVS
jgi:ABC-2 type transport system ATP-binding protein